MVVLGKLGRYPNVAVKQIKMTKLVAGVDFYMQNFAAAAPRQVICLR
jgi:hypothetical protein